MIKEWFINVPEDKRKLIAMTPTAQELWGDRVFIKKRVNEQIIYLFELRMKFWSHRISEERYEQLLPSAMSQLKKFGNRLRELRGDGEREFNGIFKKHSHLA